MVLVCQQAAVDSFQRVAFITRNDALAFPNQRLVLMLADRAAQQVAVKFGLEPHRFADQEPAQFQRNPLGARAVGGIPREAREADRLQIFRHPHGHLAQKRRRRARNGLEHLADRIPRERRLARQHLEHQTAEGKHIRLRAERFAQGLLRRCINRSAFESATLPTGFFQRQREPEIQDARAQVGAHDNVLRLEVAMHQPSRVSHGQPARDFSQQPGLLLEIKLGRKAVDRKSLHEFHDNRRRVGFIEHRKNGDYSRVAQRRGIARLVQHPPTHLRVRALAQDLDGDTAVQLFIMRGIHHAQSALAELAFDPEARQVRRLIRMFRGGRRSRPRHWRTRTAASMRSRASCRAASGS